MQQRFDTLLLSEAFRKYHAGESLHDDDIVEMLRYLAVIEFDGWVLDSRFTLFVVEIREICGRLRSYMTSRVSNNRWNPTIKEAVDNPRFLKKNEVFAKQE